MEWKEADTYKRVWVEVLLIHVEFRSLLSVKVLLTLLLWDTMHITQKSSM